MINQYPGFIDDV